MKAFVNTSMSKLRNLFLMAMALFSLAACSDEEQEELASQTDDIRKFMTSKLGLVSEREAMEAAAEEQLEFYSEMGSTVFRYISNYYDENRRERRHIRSGSLVQLTMSLYDFSSISEIRATELPLYTNDPEKLALLEKEGVNLSYWPKEPYFARLGETSMIQGLALALEGCYEGDLIQLYMTYPMAYGDNFIYLMEPESPLAIYLKVDVVFDSEVSN